MAAATGGSVTGPDDAPLNAVATDSRALDGGELFVALRADRDGHDFVGAALAAGAGGVLVDHSWAVTAAALPVPLIAVADTGAALLDLGRAARTRLATASVVAITGSVGKTSTKDLTAGALGAGLEVVASEKSFNNEIGVPLTLANAAPSIEVAVIEMGARGAGHLTLLCDVARPTVGVVTAVAPAHTEAFGSLDAVAAAKGELVEALPVDGVAVLNSDDERVAAMSARTTARVLRYSATGSASADVVAFDVSVDDALRPRFAAATPWGRIDVALEARGVHQVGNALAALAVAGSCGVSLEDAASGLASAALSPWRMELARTSSGTLVLNDAYNANPASMAAALEALAALPARRRVAVVGEMAELGAISEAEHQAVAASARRLGVDLIAVGTGDYGVTPVDGIEAAVAALGVLGPDDAVLVKASRVAGLERLAARLLESG